MSKEQAKNRDGNGQNNLPVLVEPEERHPHAYTEEHIQALMDDYNVFQGEVQRKMRTYREALSNVTGPLYKDTFKRLVGGDTMSFNHDALFQGWHNPGCRACDYVKDGLDEMWLAFRQATAYARAMQRPRDEE